MSDATSRKVSTPSRTCIPSESARHGFLSSSFPHHPLSMPRYLTFISEYDVLLPPAASLTSTFFADQVLDIARGRVLRAFGELGPFGRGQLAFKAVEQPVDYVPLPLVEFDPFDSAPRSGALFRTVARIVSA